MSQTIQKLFDTKKIPQDALEVLENFEKIIQDIFPANSKQESALPKQIRDLSHQMTDERERRRKGYMNEKTALAQVSPRQPRKSAPIRPPFPIS